MISPELYTFVMAMSPIVECRGAIPYGILAGLDPYLVMILSVTGNLLPVPFLLACLSSLERAIVGRPEGNFFRRVYVKYVDSLRRKTKPKIDRYGFLGLMLFVAVPLPFTGAWTASLVAHLFGVGKTRSLVSISLGVAIAAFLVLAFALVLKFFI
ncbi:MAG: small multi-drug export protein [Candidatus Verstraetearchaeota archaeon]|nr:small multi-drug export protein [Candidatus Verstraetearchaeota archaeon]